MRVLFVSTPLYGHLFPLLPLVRAFRERGEQVAVLTGEAVAPVLHQESIPLLEAGPTEREMAAFVLGATGVRIPVDPLTAEAEAEFFGSRIDLGFENSLSLAAAWKPDMIVSEMYDLLGPLVAAVLEVPAATVGIGPAILEYKLNEYHKRLTPRYEARGVELRQGRWYLDTCPPSLQRREWAHPEGWAGLKPEPYRFGEVTTSAPAPSNGRPRVLLTFGTYFSPPPEFLDPIIGELLSSGAELRVTLGPAVQKSDFAARDERVEFKTFTPMSELLRGVDAVLTVGGSGTVLGSLIAGLPMVVAPLGADQPVQAEQVARSGAGIAFRLGEVTPAGIAQSMLQVLAERKYGEAARKIAEEIAAMPTPQDVAGRLAETTRTS